LPDNYPKYAIFGWWYHGYPDMRDHPAQSFDLVRHRWMDTLLLGRHNGLWAEPRVLVEDSKGNWHEGHDWPLEQSRHVALRTSGKDKLTLGGGPSGKASYRDEVGAERGRWEGASVVFRSAPLDKPKLINGAPDVHLTASSSETATKWVAYLVDQAPDGSWERISHGYADSHSWKNESKWTPIEPGKRYRWKLDLMPTAVVVDKGHRIALVIASQDSRNDPVGEYCWSDYRGGCYAPSGILPAETVGRATNTVYTGRGATRVELDWVDPAKTRKPPS
jgi:X-Pro dipeptidyl-peptidase